MNYPILKPRSDKNFELYKDYEIAGYKIPAGFVTDGLTLKNRFLRIIVDKYQPKFAPFFIIHDYLTDKEQYKEADEVGGKVLFEIEKSLRTKLMMLVIRTYHKLRYGT
jgi:hypothetical protein